MMPIFHNISWEQPDELKKRIVSVLKEAQETKSFFSYYLFLVWLYEYIQCYSKLKLENVSVLENATIKLQDIKRYLSSQSRSLIDYKNFRDAVCHGVEFTNDSISIFLLSDDFAEFITKFEFTEKFYQEMVSTYNLLVNESEKHMNNMSLF